MDIWENKSPVGVSSCAKALGQECAGSVPGTGWVEQRAGRRVRDAAGKPGHEDIGPRVGR